MFLKMTFLRFYVKANRQRGVQISPCIPSCENEQNVEDELMKNLGIPSK